MNVKEIENPEKSTSKGTRIKVLSTYILLPETQSKTEKCIYHGARGFISHKPASQLREMVALAEDCIRSKDPISHYMLSLKEGEHPSNQQVDGWIDIFEREMGMNGHQIIFGLHKDTVNLHVHIELNRVHPSTGKITEIENGFDIEALHKVVARIEHEQGWQREENGRYFVLENGDLARKHTDPLQPLSPSQKQRDKENKTGEKSAQRIGIEVAGPILRSANSWEDLHRQLAENGISYEQCKTGAKIFIGDIAIKASSADRNGGLPKMQKRLGLFEPSTSPVSLITREQESLNNAPNWMQYNLARSEHEKAKQWAKQLLKEVQEQNIARLKKAQHVRRISLLEYTDWSGRSDLRCAMASVIAKEQAAELVKLKIEHSSERKRLATKYPPWPNFEDWLRTTNPQIAHDWRYRTKAPQQITGDKSEAVPPHDFQNFRFETHGVHVHYFRHDVLAFIDRGRQIDIYDWHNEDCLLAALELAKLKFGSFIVNGSEEFKKLCVELAASHDLNISNPDLQCSVQEAKEKFERQQKNILTAKESDQVKQFGRYHEAVGAESYRVTSVKVRKNNSRAIFILDKKNGEPRCYSSKEIEDHTPDMLTFQEIGETIHYTPISSGMHHILIDKLDQKNLDRLNLAGYKPAVVIQIGRNMFQAIITVAKLKTQFDQMVGIEVAKRLNSEFGDPQLHGCIHPHPAPGYKNWMVADNRIDGATCEVVSIFKSEPGECALTLELCKAIDAAHQGKLRPVDLESTSSDIGLLEDESDYVRVRERQR